MKTTITLVFALLTSGCTTTTEVRSNERIPSEIDVRSAFNGIQNPYRSDPLAAHAYSDGFITAYSLGAGALGALFSTPLEYREKIVEDAYRAGWDAGATLAFHQFSLSTMRNYTEPNKAMEPTPVNVTVPAGAGTAPFTSEAHL